MNEWMNDWMTEETKEGRKGSANAGMNKQMCDWIHGLLIGWKVSDCRTWLVGWLMGWWIDCSVCNNGYNWALNNLWVKCEWLLVCRRQQWLVTKSKLSKSWVKAASVQVSICALLMPLLVYPAVDWLLQSLELVMRWCFLVQHCSCDVHMVEQACMCFLTSWAEWL